VNYSNATIRRQDRLLDEPSARILLKTGEYGVVSMCCEPDGVYGLPMSYVWDGEKTIYLHCAPEGRKLRCIQKNNRVSFCVIGRTNVLSHKFTTEYESVVLACRAEMNLPADIRINALSLFIDKYSPNDKMAGMNYANQSFNRTEIIRLEVETWSGKSKSVQKNQNREQYKAKQLMV